MPRYKIRGSFESYNLLLRCGADRYVAYVSIFLSYALLFQTLLLDQGMLGIFYAQMPNVLSGWLDIEP